MAASSSGVGIQVREGSGSGAVVVLSGALDIRSAGAARRELLAQLSGLRPGALEVDASGLAAADVSGMVILWELAHGLVVPGVRASVSGLRPELASILASYPTPDEVDAATSSAPALPVVDGAGARAHAMAVDAREQVVFVGQVVSVLLEAVRRPRVIRWAEVARIFQRAGVEGLPLVSFVGFLVGLIIAFEAAQPLKLLGAELFVADTIGIIVLRELGPLMTAIVLVGRSGPNLAAELGTMKVNEELNALETMGLAPLRFLVVPRFVAITLLAPVLTVYAMAVGVLGGVLVMLALGFPLAVVWGQLVGAVGVSDVLVGTTKGLVFGALAGGLACLRGLQTAGGPASVGEAATRAVVSSIVAVFVADGLFAVLTYVLGV
jgi:phospholipid/cholesterol/gamma-HCH transport system permease protein